MRKRDCFYVCNFLADFLSLQHVSPLPKKAIKFRRASALLVKSNTFCPCYNDGWLPSPLWQCYDQNVCFKTRNWVLLRTRLFSKVPRGLGNLSVLTHSDLQKVWLWTGGKWWTIHWLNEERIPYRGVKGRAGDKESREEKEQEEGMGPAGKMELQKHIELVSGSQIPVPSGTSVGMPLTSCRADPHLFFSPSQKDCFHKLTCEDVTHSCI